jgi:hypothetical protein
VVQHVRPFQSLIQRGGPWNRDQPHQGLLLFDQSVLVSFGGVQTLPTTASLLAIGSRTGSWKELPKSGGVQPFCRNQDDTILVFSDLEEDLKEGYVRDIPLTVDGFEVVAVNVTKLRADNIDPRKYTNRLEAWQGRVEAGGGTWRVINDLDRLDRILG